MTNSEIYINDGLESFGRVWVHSVDIDTVSCVRYRIRISFQDIDFVIDAVDKAPSVSWDEYLQEEANEIGLNMLSIYLEKLRQLSGADEERPRWVIARLDTVIEEAHGIELHGRAVDFDPNKFLR